MDLDRLTQPKQRHTSVAGSVIHRRVTIRSKLLLLIANYSKIKRVEPLWSCIATAVEGNQKLEVQEDIEKVEKKTRETEERDSITNGHLLICD